MIGTGAYAAGTMSNDQFTNVGLAAGNTAVNYNFGEGVSGSGTLPATGSNIAEPLTVAFASVATGGLLMLAGAGRKRRLRIAS